MTSADRVPDRTLGIGPQLAVARQFSFAPVSGLRSLDPHGRFDERGWETERYRMAQATAPILDSTEPDAPAFAA
jgi:hypothetical protein